jgi:hypothetical protein
LAVRRCGQFLACGNAVSLVAGVDCLLLWRKDIDKGYKAPVITNMHGDQLSLLGVAHSRCADKYLT